MPKAQRNILIIFKVLLIAIAVLLTIIALTDENYNKYGGVLASFILPLVPDFIGKLTRKPIPFRWQLIYLLFIFISLFMGIDFDFYATVWQFDKVTHFLSGILMVVLGVFILKYFKQDRSDKYFRALFLICFAMAIAVLWEIFEFACDQLLGQNMQQLISEGVSDTMWDLTSTALGAIFGTVLIIQGKIKI